MSIKNWDHIDISRPHRVGAYQIPFSSQFGSTAAAETLRFEEILWHLTPLAVSAILEWECAPVKEIESSISQFML